MEVVKEHTLKDSISNENECFNPCFNGSCKRTRIVYIAIYKEDTVSILVLMEVVKELKVNNCQKNISNNVSILVLMEVVKEHLVRELQSGIYKRFQSLF